MNIDDLCMGCMNENKTGGPCPVCGYSGELVNPNALMPKTRLKDRYIVGKALDYNGEGITYIGYDLKNDMAVNIREYFPVGHCERSQSRVLINQGDELDFNKTLLNFLELNKTLYGLNGLSALFNTLDIFEENNTAYCVNERLRGLPLREYLPRSGGTLKFDAVKALFSPLVSSVQTLHDAGIVHAGISADTLVVCRDGRLRLSGFCVRDARVKGGFLTPQLFPGYAAIEQYGSMGSVGPWTDVYGIAATIYRTFTGNAPLEAPQRMNDDNLSIPRHIAESLPRNILEMLLMALQVLPEDRIQSAGELRTYFTSAAIQMRNAVKNEENGDDEDGEYEEEEEDRGRGEKKKKKGSGGKKYGLIAGLITAAVLLIAGGLIWFFFVREGDGRTGGKMPDLSTDESSSTVSVSAVESGEDTDPLPRFVGQLYADILENLDYTDNYKFEIVNKEYSNNVSAGYVIKQDPEPNTPVAEGATVKLYISLGPKTIAVPNLVGCTEDEAKIKLFEAGFPSTSIQFAEKYDDDKSPSVVIEMSNGKGDKVSAGTRVSPDERLIIYINSYDGGDDEDSSDYWG